MAGDERGPERIASRDDRRLPLKNGELVEPRAGYSAWQTLARLAEQSPHLLAAMASLVRGQSITSEAASLLEQHWLVRPDGTVPETVAAVLRAGYRDTPDGGVLVNPFALEAADDRHTFEALQRRATGYWTEISSGGDDGLPRPGR